MINQEQYNKYLKNWYVMGGVISSGNIISLLLHHKTEVYDGDSTKKILNLHLCEENENIAIEAITQSNKYGGYDNAHLTVKDHQVFLISITGNYLINNDSGGDLEALKIPTARDGNNYVVWSVNAATTIDERIYVVGSWRTVGYSKNDYQWVNAVNRNEMPEPEGVGLSPQGFSVVAGTDKNNVYAGGQAGDLWHFDDKKWSQCSIPTNAKIKAICVKDKNNIYVVSVSRNNETTVLSGYRDNWRVLLKTKEIPYGPTDVIFHEGCLWLTNDYGLWFMKDGQLLNANTSLGEDILRCVGNLYSTNDSVLMCGTGGVALYQNNKWTQLYKASLYESYY